MTVHNYMKKLQKNQRFRFIPEEYINQNKKPLNSKIHIPENFFLTEPIMNMLADKNPATRLSGLKQIKGMNNRNLINKLHNLTFDPSRDVQFETQKKLKPIEMFYRRKFSFYQDNLTKFPDQPGYKLGFSLTCLRYAQNWVVNMELREYFLKQAIKYMNQLIRIHEPKVNYFYLRGQVLFELNQKRAAIEDFKKVLHQRPNHTGAILSLIELYLQTYKPSAINQLIGKLKQKKLPPKIKAAIEFWNFDC